MDLNELKELIGLLEDSGLSELEIEEEGRRVRLTKQGGGYVTMPAPVAVPAPHVATPPFPGAPGNAAAEKTMADEGLVTIDSPMVGTFYGSPAPGEPAFIELGDTVTANQTVCIVEAMKIMNEVASKVSGKVERILVENGEPVEFGQPLFAIRPA